jgi:hypothetical protein
MTSRKYLALAGINVTNEVVKQFNLILSSFVYLDKDESLANENKQLQELLRQKDQEERQRNDKEQKKRMDDLIAQNDEMYCIGT